MERSETPGNAVEKYSEPAERATANDRAAAARSAGFDYVWTRSWGLRPRLYAAARSAGLEMLFAPLLFNSIRLTYQQSLWLRLVDPCALHLPAWL